MILAQFIKSTLESMLILLCATGILLLAGAAVLQNQVLDVTKSAMSASQDDMERIHRDKRVSRLLAQTEGIQTQYVLWTPMLAEFSASIPDGVTLTRMFFDKDAKTAEFSGTARTRDDLLALERRFQELSYISSIALPLSNLTQQENISFTLTAELTEL
ncbi:MAG: hypothetical protein A3C90_01380 [Candidatus Magasanikbacteria bacterium RIFCSPHIGHO2_02_FULL_51_14]|uniref:PilN domain-containing protein n=1 Tax=Candidatus Magasanikbacteria bacterium RIFCSPHIGHO2_02_FULL_51_14 TaxID=1798683 RepID=A0A1F6MHJ9_9BACT|nr:MAG: hypothetical protein A3C90_01380 [Candidatus Magasanikbacteria bacterium RIFCSPHIGHO2_02_FULL_51_14]